MKLPKPVSSNSSENGEPSWRWRRSMAFAIVAFCCLMIGGLGLLPQADDTEVNQSIVDGSFWLLGVVFLLYSGFATAQDVFAIMTVRSGRPYAEKPNSVAPAAPDVTVQAAQVVVPQDDPNVVINPQVGGQ